MNLKNPSITACFSAFILLLAACKKSNDAAPSSSTPEPEVKNKIAYLYKQNSNDADAYKKLMDVNGCTVTLIDMSEAASADYTKFDLIVIGNNTADDAYDFSAPIVNAIQGSSKPVLMVGLGGAHYGETINTTVSYATTEGLSFPTTCIVLDSSQAIYKSPKQINIPSTMQLDIFDQPTAGQGFNCQQLANYPNVNVITQGMVSRSTDFPVTFESGRYGFFGYYNNVNTMTQAGKDFMVNLTYYVGNLK